MYCINCGVKLADTETTCPLCLTKVYHPDIDKLKGVPLYPQEQFPANEPHPLGFSIIATIVFLLSILVVGTCDIELNHAITWSGYVTGALLLSYELLILPTWFRKTTPAIFVPCGFASIALYLLYIDLATNGKWFLGFALPTTAIIGIIVTCVCVLIFYLRRGVLYIIGGALLALGAAMPIIEYLLDRTFALERTLSWSVYTITPLVFLGGTLIFLAICRPAREAVERKLFF